MTRNNEQLHGAESNPYTKAFKFTKNFLKKKGMNLRDLQKAYEKIDVVIVNHDDPVEVAERTFIAQRKLGVKPDGYFGLKTYTALQKAIVPKKTRKTLVALAKKLGETAGKQASQAELKALARRLGQKAGKQAAQAELKALARKLGKKAGEQAAYADLKAYAEKIGAEAGETAKPVRKIAQKKRNNNPTPG